MDSSNEGNIDSELPTRKKENSTQMVVKAGMTPKNQVIQIMSKCVSLSIAKVLRPVHKIVTVRSSSKVCLQTATIELECVKCKRLTQLSPM